MKPAASQEVDFLMMPSDLTAASGDAGALEEFKTFESQGECLKLSEMHKPAELVFWTWRSSRSDQSRMQMERREQQILLGFFHFQLFLKIF